MENLTKKKLILASKSPRRKELLQQACIAFDIIPSKINEKNIQENEPEKLVRTLSYLKSMDISKKYPDSWVLGADTIVYIDNFILGKPYSASHAIEMLNSLSNRKHNVLTGFTLSFINNNKIITEVVSTKVYFKKLSNKEIKWYLSTNEYIDKAGGYGIQGYGSFFIKKIQGSYTNVVGLPLSEVMEYLIQENIVEF